MNKRIERFSMDRPSVFASLLSEFRSTVASMHNKTRIHTSQYSGAVFGSWDVTEKALYEQLSNSEECSFIYLIKNDRINFRDIGVRLYSSDLQLPLEKFHGKMFLSANVIPEPEVMVLDRYPVVIVDSWSRSFCPDVSSYRFYTPDSYKDLYSVKGGESWSLYIITFDGSDPYTLSYSQIARIHDTHLPSACKSGRLAYTPSQYPLVIDPLDLKLIGLQEPCADGAELELQPFSKLFGGNYHLHTVVDRFYQKSGIFRIGDKYYGIAQRKSKPMVFGNYTYELVEVDVFDRLSPLQIYQLSDSIISRMVEHYLV